MKSQRKEEGREMGGEERERIRTETKRRQKKKLRQRGATQKEETKQAK
jgi:hypothetical protein